MVIQLILLLALLNLLDATLTWQLLADNRVVESNFVPGLLIECGPFVFLAVKGLVPLACGWVLRKQTRAIWICCWFYVAVCVFNVGAGYCQRRAEK